MEEILASIRRIIEDSDPGRKQTEDGAELKQDFEPVAGERAEAEITSFRVELRAGSEARKPFTLADVQARMTAEAHASEQTGSTDSASLASVEAEASGGAHVEASAASTVPDTKSADVLVADWRRDIATAGQPVQNPEAAYPEPEVEIFEGELADDFSLLSQSSDEASDDMPVKVEATARPAIVSEHTGRQVAAAFGELSEAFASRSKKSFDEMAEEMLRPMLQDWLDNNLPTLVERLVREEIERVARGA
ncbi:PopZ family protein [Mesorhizobium sp. A556]